MNGRVQSSSTALSRSGPAGQSEGVRRVRLQAQRAAHTWIIYDELKSSARDEESEPHEPNARESRGTESGPF